MWGTGQLALTKTIIVVDEGINVHDMNDVIWAMTTRADAARDTVIIDGAPTDTLDLASPRVNHGSKMGIDATQKTAEEGYEREVQIPVSADSDTVNLLLVAGLNTDSSASVSSCRNYRARLQNIPFGV